MSRRVRPLLLAIVALVALPALAYFAGPVYRVDARITAPSLPTAGGDAAVLEPWLAAAESRFPDIVPGAEKTIVWAHPDRRRTPLAVVYLHGYTATRQEVAPLCDQLAAALGANLFYTRLAETARLGTADLFRDMVACLHRLGTDPKSDRTILARGLHEAVPLEPFEIPIVVTDPGSAHVVALAIGGVRRENPLFTAPIDRVTTAEPGWRRAEAGTLNWCLSE